MFVAWQAMVAAGKLESDVAQYPVVKAFAVLASQLQSRQQESDDRGEPNALDRFAYWLHHQLFPEGTTLGATSIKGIYLYGSVGRGKSLIMKTFLDHIGMEAHRYHFHQFIQRVHAERNTKGAGETISWIPDGALLCLDEFEITNVVDAMLMERMFRQLWARRVVVVFTTNLPPDDQYTAGLQRERFLPFIAAVKRECTVLNLAGDDDFRRKHGTEQAGYVISALSKPPTVLQERFLALAPKAHMCRLRVEGDRYINIHRTANRCAMISFDELCNKPRGRADYFAVVRAFDVLYLFGIPKLDETQRNAATRLRELVDVLYDCGVQVAVSAAAPADALYTGHSARASFHRTASRLTEMTAQ